MDGQGSNHAVAPWPAASSTFDQHARGGGEGGGCDGGGLGYSQTVGPATTKWGPLTRMAPGAVTWQPPSLAHLVRFRIRIRVG